MRNRILASMGVLVAVVAVGLVLPAAGQAPKKYNPPKTPWGDPDLQGVWNDATSGAPQICFAARPTHPDIQ